MFLQSLKQRRQWRRARQYAARYEPLLIGVTGSWNVNLITEALELVLSEQGRLHVVETASGINLPESPVQTIITKISAQKPGDVDHLAQQLPWKIAVVTNIGSKHLDLFGNKAAVVHEHTSLVSALPEDSHAILNADDELVANMARHTAAHVVFYGTAARSHVCLVRSVQSARGGFSAEVADGKNHYQLSLPNVISFSQIYPALAALAVCQTVGGNMKSAVNNLSQLHPAPGEMSITAGFHGARLIDGSADATLETMLAGLHTLRTFPGKRRIAILGDIADLGGETVFAHKKIGRAAAENVHIFIAVGPHMRHAGAQALQNRPPGSSTAGGPDVHHFETSAEVGEWLAPYLTSDDTVLITGSPGMHMEKIVADLSNSA